MRLFLLWTAVTLAIAMCCVPVSRAAEALEDVVYLKNGGVIRGTIVELKPNESAKIQTADGSVFVWRVDEIERIAKEPALAREESYLFERQPAFARKDEPEPRAETSAATRVLKIPGKKSPVLAFALSYLLPGAGQLYNGQVGKGFTMMAMVYGGLSFAFAASPDLWETESSIDAPEGLVIAVVAVALTSYAWSLVDAPIIASRKNREREALLRQVSIRVNQDGADRHVLAMMSAGF